MQSTLLAVQFTREQTHPRLPRRLEQPRRPPMVCRGGSWCSGRYKASAPVSVANPRMLIDSLRYTVGVSGIVFAGFDFPIGLPSHFAKCADKSSFPDFLRHLGTDDWKHFYSVCDQPDQITIHRPFNPNRAHDGCTRQNLVDGLDAPSLEALLRKCELGGDGQRRACSLFWTLGGNQVGRAAIAGWRDMLVPALLKDSIKIWPFDGALDSLLQPGHTVIAETYPAECYQWFGCNPPRSKTDIECRDEFGLGMLRWSVANGVAIEPRLVNAIESGFPEEYGNDDGFDAVVGLLGMLQIVFAQRTTGELDDHTIRNVEGWILGRQFQPVRTIR